ncbi:MULTISPECIES: DUF6074 family protein [unclassified Mesorhizobium]|uniref:DUF6074 family protein n=1 Tax=unclassified Mesorhizobium TaxID=325217 RepID=UPI0003CF2022|nr:MULTISPECIES: DUF6074 family protein [unclassified Mesorhizobium]ESY51586.1 hypothetical protein X745_22530 [Mesorhizobium sp. LNJC374B00]ESY58471.1 hypothetical protein X744_17040 [Mesorhizobium sp. LNJC372A00]WJI78974.1 DUF6074 family protein [Mesorhizobium sp. C374B]WJI85510.1 DUF6074 family protein [Mesorhizobium sp. C372A]
MQRDLPLFECAARPCQILAFPLACRVGKVRDVATKLSGKTTEKHAVSYRLQVDVGLRTHLAKTRLRPEAIDAEVAAFWSSVRIEMQRIAYRDHGRGGATP